VRFVDELFREINALGYVVTIDTKPFQAGFHDGKKGLREIACLAIDPKFWATDRTK
jgi:hypothetical protein